MSHFFHPWNDFAISPCKAAPSMIKNYYYMKRTVAFSNMHDDCMSQFFLPLIRSKTNEWRTSKFHAVFIDASAELACSARTSGAMSLIVVRDYPCRSHFILFDVLKTRGKVLICKAHWQRYESLDIKVIYVTILVSILRISILSNRNSAAFCFHSLYIFIFVTNETLYIIFYLV